MEVSVSYLLRSVYLENTNIYDRGLFLGSHHDKDYSYTALTHAAIRYRRK